MKVLQIFFYKIAADNLKAHHCTGSHPAHRIMSNFYIQRSSEPVQLPRVLGLSASPVMVSTKPKEMSTCIDMCRKPVRPQQTCCEWKRPSESQSSDETRQIERNLRATARTPKVHRQELLRFVHRPILSRVDYTIETHQNSASNLLASLRYALNNYDSSKDPYMLGLLAQRQQGYDVSKQMHKLVMNGGKTYCKDQLRTLVIKAEATVQELGPSPMDWVSVILELRTNYH